MALPLAVPIALSVGKALFGWNAKKKQQKAVKKAALSNLQALYSDLNARLAQEDMALANARVETQERAAVERGAVEAGAASANVAGASVTALLNDITRQESNAVSILDRNATFVRGQVARQKRGAVAQYESTLAGAPAPSLLAAGLELGGDVLDAYSRWR
jgi:hypothetical protein